MRSATRAAAVTSASSSKTANSSPPSLAAVSSVRRPTDERDAPSRQHMVPGGMARLSLMVLKLSRSMKRTAVSARGAAVESVLDSFAEQAAIGQPGQGIVERLECQLLF